MRLTRWQWLLLASAVLLLGGGVAVSQIRGIRNKNPLNLRRNGFTGFVGVDRDGYAIFDTLENGVRAAARQLKINYNRGATTIREQIAIWAPSNENDTYAYTEFVSRRTSFDEDDNLDFTSPEILALVMRAMIQQECGYSGSLLVSDTVLREGIARA